ncbi:hypothetical protein BV25DRAFT_1830967 [Artomyces pyxidatus]|uniref:Uncharacterized protein n=1 Tax=Artomyces pyxidatus TaxID=48021 RepID=A0ACB8SM13_9AGAM|nr:hypothetical protein BV25DRAFT_1830967 [Artomyces pyxidatus]
MSKRVQEYTVQRITYDSELPITDVLARLDGFVHRDKSEGVALSAVLQAKTKDELVRSINAITDGFMLFGTLQHSRWLKVYFETEAIPGVFVYTIGNPLIAQTMLKHSLLAGLYVPPKLIIIGKDVDERKGTKVVYDVPSSMIAAGDSGELRKAALALDAKLEDLVRRITGAE